MQNPTQRKNPFGRQQTVSQIREQEVDEDRKKYNNISTMHFTAKTVAASALRSTGR